MSDGGMTDDLSALAWVHDELRRSLEAAGKALRRFVRDHEAVSASDIDAVDPAVLRTARTQLHQGVGALELIGQTAAARVLAASEALVERHVSRPHKLTAAMVDDLERSSFALLDYLSRLLAGKAPSPLSLFPRYRAVLEAAQVERVHPADLWTHDWEWRALPADRSVLPLQPDPAVQKTFEAQLLPLMRALDPKPTAGLLSDVCAGLGAGATTDLPVATLWQLSSAMFEAQAQGLLGFDVFSKRVASRLLAQFRAFARGVHEVPDRLAQDLLFFCAQSAVPAETLTAPRLHAAREAYGLGAWLPVDYATTTLGRFDPALIAQAKKRVVAAKDAWSGVAGGELHRLTGLSEQFALVAESLKRLFPHGELFATELQHAVAQTQQSLSSPPAPLAMEVATSLLYVEAALDDIDIDHPEQAERVARLATRLAAVRAGHPPEPLESWMEELYRRVSDRQTMGSVVQELRASLSEAEKQIDAYFRDPARREVLIPVPNTLASMRGVLSVLGMDHATAALLRMRDEVDQLGETEVDPALSVHAERFERLAGNLGALGFLIDMLSVQPAMAKSLFEFDAESGTLRPVMGRTPDRPVAMPMISAPAPAPAPAPAAEAPGIDAALIEQAQNLAFASVREDVTTAEVARDLERLSRDAHQADAPVLATTLDDAREALGRAAESADDTAAVRGALSEALVDFVASTAQPIGLDIARPAVAAAAVLPVSDLALDDEMREVFLEEAREVLAEARSAAASLRSASDDLGLLTTLRRAYHTLKGSSRMVGLKAFGDGAWIGEQLYNSQLAGQGGAPAALLDFTDWSIDYLGAWVDDIAANRSGAHTVAAVEEAARQVHEGGGLDASPYRSAADPQATVPADEPAPDFDLDLAAEPAPSALARAVPFELPGAAELDLGSDRPDPAAEPEPVDAPTAFEAFAFELDAGSVGVEPAAKSDFDLDAELASFDLVLEPPAAAPPPGYVRSRPSALDMTEGALLDPFDSAPTEPLPLPDMVESGWDEGEVGSIDLDFDLDLPQVAPAIAGAALPDGTTSAEPVAPASDDLADRRGSERASPAPVDVAATGTERAVSGPSDAGFGAEAGEASAGKPVSEPYAGSGPEHAEPDTPDVGGAEVRAFDLPYAVLGDDAGTPSASTGVPLESPADLAPAGPAATRAEPGSSEPAAIAAEPGSFEPIETTASGGDAAPFDLPHVEFGDAAETPAAATEGTLAAPPPLADASMPSAEPDGPATTTTASVGTPSPSVVDASISTDADADADAPSANIAYASPSTPAEPTVDRAGRLLGERSSDDPRTAAAAPASVEPALLPIDGFEPLHAANATAPVSEPAGIVASAAPGAEATAGVASAAGGDEESIRSVGPLRISTPLFNIYVGEADELSRRLSTEVGEWAGELHRPVGEIPIALAHSLAGNSATVGYRDLSQLARSLENALTRSQKIGSGTPEEARLFVDATEEIRGLLHQFAAGFLRAPSAELLRRLGEHELSSTARLDAGLADPIDTLSLSSPLAAYESTESATERSGRSDRDDDATVGGSFLRGQSVDALATTPAPAADADDAEVGAAADVGLAPAAESVESIGIQEPIDPVEPVLRSESDPTTTMPGEPFTPAEFRAPAVEATAPTEADGEAAAEPEAEVESGAEAEARAVAIDLAAAAESPATEPTPEPYLTDFAVHPVVEPIALDSEPGAPSASARSIEPDGTVDSVPVEPSAAIDFGPVERSAPMPLEPVPVRPESIEPELIAASADARPTETPLAAADEATPDASDLLEPRAIGSLSGVDADDAAIAHPSIAPAAEPRYDPLGVVAFKPLGELPTEAPRAIPSQGELDTDDSVDAVDAIDTELFPIFQEEAEELLPQLASRLREWYRRPGDAAAPAACMRTLHTLKGGARLAGAMRLGEMAHQLETRIERLAAAESIASSDVEALLVRSDALAQTFETLKAGEPAEVAGTSLAAPIAPVAPVAPVDLSGASPSAVARATPPEGPEAAAFHDAMPSAADAPRFAGDASAVPPFAVEPEAGETPSADAAPVAPVPSEGSVAVATVPAVDPVAAAAAAASSAPPPAAAPVPAAAADASRTVDWSRFPISPPGARKAADKAQATRSAVRVPAPVLDRLINQAGEVSIARSRIETGVVQLRTSLGDLTENLDRLRTQLRDIEIQGEVQMSSRLEAAKAASQTFDPLEFDRFTRFQELTRTMAEAVNDVGTVQRSLQRSVEIAEDELAAQARMTRELQDGLLRTRMVEFESLSDRLYRVVRQTAKDTGRSVRLDIVGGSVEVDRGVLDRMTGAFEHLLRNAVGHGIEAPEVRVAAGKEATGAIVVVLTHDGNEVGVEFRDDGAGLALDRIRAKAERVGLLQPGQSTSDADLANLIFEPGFTTTEAVTEVAGRGVGMDVVRSEVQAMGGRIETATAAGRGTSFKLVLPLTTAVTQVVMLRCGETRVAVPSALIEAVRRATPAEIEAARTSGSYAFGERTLQFFWLGALLQTSPRSVENDGRTRTVVIVRSAQQRIAVQVDEVVGNQEVVVKNLGPQLSRLPGLAGISLLASGAVALIYNPVALATLYGDAARAAMGELDAPQRAAGGSGHPTQALGSDEPDEAPLVMVVDDSLTVRRVTQRLLQREGYRVLLAKDGLDALEQLADHLPAVVLSDIEMPRMDGFDLIRNLRSQARLRHLPVIMITSRIAQKHRDYAAELGVDHYLGKPYSEEDLLALIGRYTTDRATVM